ncbi:CBS domain-containing protein [Amycolatopsis acidicola]|uniref:CBS domain-containing protein n=1 Tax=Amycolatopsis acidicola TaxID=2596893 RepID=A0A5N0V555_9PSEU|nr:CBS domain-containing protein [Amycolatopsis acidicola]KAA9160223.1 CBS domain-containing protein [Amycolatopsis acidicola]
MKTTRVRDVMTSEVHSVRRTTPFKAVAGLLAGYRISAMPVVDDERTVVGVVSEADLMREQVPPRRWRRSRERDARTAGELMTSPAITATADTTVAEAARRMTRGNVKRLPVVDAYGKLVAVVSRADLIALFARPDEELREEIELEVVERALCVPRASISVSVTDGVATLSGKLERKSLVPIAETLAARVPGVVGVVGDLSFDFDDSRVRGTEPANEGVLHDVWHRE